MAKRKLDISIQPPCPSGVSRAYKGGWNARLKGKRVSSFRWPGFIVAGCLEEIWTRYDNRTRGYIACSRAIGRHKKALRLAEETIRLNHEHDMLVALGEELVA